MRAKRIFKTIGKILLGIVAFKQCAQIGKPESRLFDTNGFGNLQALFPE